MAAVAQEQVRRVALAYGRYNRGRKLRFAERYVSAHDVRSVLFVGVHVSPSALNNLIERTLQDRVDRAVASGLSPVSESAGWREYVTANALDLPFDDDAFDLVYSNAVIEHVGDEAAQRQLVSEHARVGRRWIITTPNRWFPVESHRHVLFRHWSPRWKDPRGSVTRLLGPGDLRRLLPEGSAIRGSVFSPTLTAHA